MTCWSAPTHPDVISFGDGPGEETVTIPGDESLLPCAESVSWNCCSGIACRSWDPGTIRP